MDFTNLVSRLPLWAVFVLTMAICVAAVEAGASLAGSVLRRKNETEPEAPLGSLVGSVLGLLAFILAFTFGMTSSRFDARRQLVLEEANAIGMGLSMLAVGYQVGMSGMRRLRGTPLLAAAFSLVIMMTADIDRPNEGLMRVSQQPIADVQQRMVGDSP